MTVSGSRQDESVAYEPPGFSTVTMRVATPVDATRIAHLHADSWRRHYRFAYPTDFFGESLDEDRTSTWIARLSNQPDHTHTVVAEMDGQLVGFVHVVLDDDVRWGSLIDNLHVRHAIQRSGIGASLLDDAKSFAETSAATSRIYLWVLEGNHGARAFYRRAGGREVETVPAAPPALPGINKIRTVWSTAT